MNRAKACKHAPAEYDIAMPDCTSEQVLIQTETRSYNPPKAAYDFVKLASLLWGCFRLWERHHTSDEKHLSHGDALDHERDTTQVSKSISLMGALDHERHNTSDKKHDVYHATQI